MQFSQRTIQRMHERIGELVSDVDRYLDAFERLSLFSGPSLFFHAESIEKRRAHASVVSAIADRELLVSIYATLSSWGMHRMGPRGAKLVDFPVFEESIQGLASSLTHLESFRLDGLTPSDGEQVAEALWEVISALRVSATESRLVAGTKALHHLLPDLVPPMDRQYTDRFFFGAPRTFNSLAFQNKPEAAFAQCFQGLAGIARECSPQFLARVGRGMHTGIPKCVDNAVVGYMLVKRGSDEFDTS